MSDTPRRKVLVFRKRMLPYSETFIAAQGRHLPSWEAVFAGATEDRSGMDLLQGAPTCTLACQFSSWSRPLATLAFKRFGHVPDRWLRALRTHGPALVHAHFGPDGVFMGLPLAKALGVPLVVTFHGFDITIDHPSGSYRRMRPRLFQEADRIIAVSDYIRGKLMEHGCPEGKIVKHFIGIDLERFQPLPPGTERRDIVFVGRLTEKKGCRYLIQAMQALSAAGRTERLHLVGDGALRAELELMAAPLGDKIIFHGRRNPDFVRGIVGSAAVFCAPSVTSSSGDSEGLGMMNLEAMALGTPVVSTFHTAIPEAVLHEQTGILVPEADPAALAAALTRCLDNENLSGMFGRNGITHVRAMFDLRKQCQALESIYEDVIATGRTLSR